MSASTQNHPAANLLEQNLVGDFPTPDLVKALIDNELIERHSLTRVVLHLAYYALRDTSDLDRTQEAITRLIHFLSQAESFITDALHDSLLSNIKSLVADAMKQKASLN